MHVTGLVWAVTLVLLLAVLIFDVFVIGRKPHEPSTKECSAAITFYVLAALAFAGFVWWHWGGQYAGEFVAGWLTEYSLSIDNLFIFLIIMSRMRVPRALQQFALMVGIILALVFRGIFIAAGAAIIEAFAFVFFLFGAYLVYTAYTLVRDYRRHDDAEEQKDNFVIRWAKRRFRFADEFHGSSLRVKVDGVKLFTPMLLVIIALGSTDLLFALDSIPAIYGLTQQAFLVFTANVFALMGLRQLYFLIGGLLKRLVYLSLGLSFILAFIGVKLVLHALHHYGVITFEVPLWLSLTVLVATLAVTIVASLIKSRHNASEAAVSDGEPAVGPSADAAAK
ncbi:MAG: TerC/Alx family metal homeostasis membrane protein [Propionibacteriaceae bacterium]|jgi:tellurite resistance protein TerC|nr:TerC/Alx family metal homeostasis membrane protein [Propionibacteriaceae bacterium]